MTATTATTTTAPILAYATDAAGDTWLILARIYRNGSWRSVHVYGQAAIATQMRGVDTDSIPTMDNARQRVAA